MPGQNFVYRVAVTNSNDANVSTAYGIKIVGHRACRRCGRRKPFRWWRAVQRRAHHYLEPGPLGKKNASKELSYTARLQPPLTSPRAR